MTQPATLDEIEQRLRGLPETLVVDSEDARAMDRIVELRFRDKPVVKAQAARGRLVRLGAVGMAIVAVLLVNVAAAYYAPTYSRALADAPGIGGSSSKVLAAFGLNADQVTAINDSATSSGHTLRLAAGYADGLRTVLFISVDGRGLDGNPKGYGMNPGDYGLGNSTLTDQFGHTYVPNGVGTPNWIPFTPLAWPASKVGARLTLHVTSIDAMWLRSGAEQQGDWSLHATLVAEPAHTLALPAAIHTSQANYTFTSIRSSATTLIIRWTVDGPALDRVTSYGRLGAAGPIRSSRRPHPPQKSSSWSGTTSGPSYSTHLAGRRSSLNGASPTRSRPRARSPSSSPARVATAFSSAARLQPTSTAG
jgi:hypothetical protein